MSFLTQEGMKTLLSEVPTNTIQGRRHLAILAFLYDTGARANELISFSAHNLNLTKPYHVILSGKGRKKRIVPIWKGHSTLPPLGKQDCSLWP